MDQPLDDFWAEAEDLFGQARTSLEILQGQPPAHLTQQSLNSLFRATHTLKGMAGMIGFSKFSKAAHRLEDVFDLMRQNLIQPSLEVLEILGNGMESLEAGLADLQRGRPEPDDYLFEIRKKLAEIEISAKAAAGEIRDLSHLLDLPPNTILGLTEFEKTRVTASLEQGIPIQGVELHLDYADFDEVLRDFHERLTRQGELISTLPWELPPEKDGIAFMLLLACAAPDLSPLEARKAALASVRLLGDPKSVPRIEKAAPEPPPAEEQTPEPLPMPSSAEAEVLKLPVGRIDELEAQLSEAIQLRDQTVAWLMALSERIENSALRSQLDAGRKLLKAMEDHLLGLQRSLLQTRMVKVETLFARLEPLFKKLGKELGKPVKHIFSGGELELDRALVGRLMEPLIHLIRNAMDHGLEAPEERKQRGKAEQGTIKVTASQRGRSLRIDIRDDGRGFDTDRIKAKAIARGLLHAGKEYSPDEIFRTVFEPGLSTADSASEISGRGVGMDVVKSEIEALGGEVRLSSEWRRGSLVRLVLPLSRAILHCLKVRCGKARFAIPVSGIVRVQLADQPLMGGDRLKILGQEIPFEHLEVCLGGLDRQKPQTIAVVVAQSGSTMKKGLAVAVGVDEILDRGEVMVRPLPEFAMTPAVMGASPVEDGVLWVLDPEALLNRSMESLMQRVVHASKR